MTTFKTLDRNGNENIINSPNNIEIVSATDGFDLVNADTTVTNEVRFNEIDTTTNNPKLEITVGGTTIKTIQLNRNDINIDVAGSDFDLTDDILNFKSEDSSDNTINFSKYNISASVNASGNIEISQNGSIVSTISQNATGIAYDNADSTLTATDVKNAIDDLDDKIEGFSGGVEEQDDFVATAGQTAFTLTQTPISQVNIQRNGITLAKTCLSVSGTTATYDPAQNGTNPMVVGDRVSFTYEY